ncbi:hypothetical protein E2C01_055136 [Portunus trituberculatus]|uniref:Uncharacterized protein n=1 Tax=Portunus trituberculatus TaxID=210409 RepID=A0A5B7GTX1_PORTR|nr:hypothetical protein [Portunus trituberculatus]
MRGWCVMSGGRLPQLPPSRHRARSPHSHGRWTISSEVARRQQLLWTTAPSSVINRRRHHQQHLPIARYSL